MNNKFLDYNRIQMADFEEKESLILVHHSIINEDFKMHWHDFYEIEYILSGSGYHIMNGMKYDLKKGSLFIVDPTDFHELFIYEPLNTIKICFDASVLHPEVFQTLCEILQNLNLALNEEEEEFLGGLFSFIYKESLVPCHPYSNHISKNLLECILFHVINIFRNHPENTERHSNNDVMQKVLLYIHKNFRSQINLSTVSELVHLSPNHLSRVFHKTFEVTFNAYINDLRLKFAKKLLINSQLSVTEICFESGFGSLSNFMRGFKQKFSTSPQKYREKGKIR